jgi:hypothetical protein
MVSKKELESGERSYRNSTFEVIHCKALLSTRNENSAVQVASRKKKQQDRLK